jgi:hypothetical protein
MALEMPMDKLLTTDGLCAVHAVLCRGQPDANPGHLRTIGVLSGGRHNCHPSKVSARLTDCLDVARANVATALDDGGEGAAVWAAAVVALGVLDVHPFVDGNGRLARVLVSCVLRAAGQPFVIALCATEEQRGTFVSTVRAALASPDDLHGDGGLALRRLVTQHTVRAWREVERMWVEALDESRPLRDLAVKADRESRRTGGCSICLVEDSAANIATLCCGAAVHLNCMARWISEADSPSCVMCRAEMPAPEPLSAEAAAAAFHNALRTAGVLEVDDTTAEDGDDGTDTTTADTTTTTADDDTSAVDHTVAAVDTTSVDTDDRADALAAAAGYGDDDVGAWGGPGQHRHNEQQQRPTQVKCCRCHLIAAAGCTNEACGACCRLIGQSNCARHRTVVTSVAAQAPTQ